MQGCASSDWTPTETPEVAPLRQPPPHLEVQVVPGGFQSAVSLWWTGPLEPNGKVLYYELYRRQTATQPEKATPMLTYNGSESSFMDSELLPFTEYEYQVRNVCYQQLRLRICTQESLPRKMAYSLKSHLQKCGV